MSNLENPSEGNAVPDENLDFLPPLPPNTPNSFSQNANRLTLEVSDLASSASDIFDTVKKGAEIIEKLRSGDVAGSIKSLEAADAKQLSEALDAARKVINVVKPAFSGNKTKGPSGPEVYGGVPSEYHDNQTLLSMAPHPTEVRLNTGIVPNFIVDDYNRAIAGYKCPLHINLYQVELPSNTQSTTGAFLSDAVLFDLKTRITANLTYSPASSLVSPTNLRNMLNSVINALANYYSVARYYVYSNMISNSDKERGIPFNRNEAIEYLANLASDGDTVRAYLRLRRILKTVPIPPNLNDLIFYLYQIYTSSPEPSSPLLAFMPNQLYNGVPTLASDLNACCVDLLTYTDTFALISRAIPQWRSTPLLTGNGNFLHDYQFTTLWVNAPYHLTGTNGTAYSLLGPSVSSENTTIRYNVYSNNLDGGIFALTALYSTGVSGWLPSLVKPLTGTGKDGLSNISSRFSWFVVGGIYGFYDSMYRAAASLTRDDTYTITSLDTTNTGFGGLALGAEAGDGVTAATVSYASEKLLDWMLSWETVPVLVNSKLQPSELASGGKMTANPRPSSRPNPKNKVNKDKFKGKKGK